MPHTPSEPQAMELLIENSPQYAEYEWRTCAARPDLSLREDLKVLEFGKGISQRFFRFEPENEVLSK
jgi:hypothetical protein